MQNMKSTRENVFRCKNSKKVDIIYGRPLIVVTVNLVVRWYTDRDVDNWECQRQNIDTDDFWVARTNDK